MENSSNMLTPKEELSPKISSTFDMTKMIWTLKIYISWAHFEKK
jgi:hypothetical protein